MKSLIESVEYPVTEQYIQKVIDQFNSFANHLVEDPQWNSFWNSVKEKYNLSDEEVEMRQGDVINGYRMKLFSLAQRKLELDSIQKIKQIENDKDNPKQQELLKAAKDYQNKIVLCKDLILKINAAERDAKENKFYDHVKDFYKSKAAHNMLIKYELNNVIKDAINLVQKAKANGEINIEAKKQIQSEIQKMLDEVWKKIEDVPMGDPNGEKFMQLFWQRGSKKDL